INLLKKIAILPFLFAFVPIAFIYLFLRDIPLLSSLFIEYVNSGTSFFLPLFPSYTIIFHFTTGHLIDIIIVINIIGFLERCGYYYYVNVCLKRCYLEICLEMGFLETNGTQEESPLSSDLILNLKGDSNNIINEESFEVKIDKRSRIDTNRFGHKSRYYISYVRLKHNSLDYLQNSFSKIYQHNRYSTTLQNSLINSFTNYHFPSIYNSDSYTNILIEEGR
ncbi:MAG: hypothetical protein ACFFFY_07050, partial [Promethearchaeota archaeon]